jgi:cytochrome c oxidase assembly protein subunit 20
MADDTRQSPKAPALTDDGVAITRESLNAHPENKPFSGTQWQDPSVASNQSKEIIPPTNANLAPGGTQNTAGGQVPDITITNAWPTLSDFSNLPKRPCVRDAYMTGMYTGFALGGSRLVFGRGLYSASSWFVASTCVASGVMYQWCLYRRQAERDGMIRAVEILNKNGLEKKAREQAKERQREERRRLKDEELEVEYAKRREEDARGKSWWNVW